LPSKAIEVTLLVIVSTTEMFFDPGLVTYNFESSLFKIQKKGSGPTITLLTLLLMVLITETLFEALFVTYNLVSLVFNAQKYGSCSTTIVDMTVVVAVSITDTLADP
jgi:hypothetical protein